MKITGKQRLLRQILDPMKSMWTIVGLIFVSCCFEGTAKTFNGKPLHLHMSKREVEHYFGTSDHAQVPEYDVVAPFHSNGDGEFVSSFNYRGNGRQRRSLHDLNRPNYKLRAFGKDFHLKLVRNDRLMAPGLQLEKMSPNGRVSRSPVLENTFYLGHVASDPDSLVAISNGNGLKGLIRHKEDAMFIQPLPDHLAKHFRSERDTHPHLIHKAGMFPEGEIDYFGLEHEPFSDTDILNLNVAPEIRTKRDASNIPGDDGDYKFMELGLITDNQIAEGHGDEIDDHLLLIGNIVSGMFRDKSIGKKKIVTTVMSLEVITYKKLDGTNVDSSRMEKLSAIRKYVDGKKEHDMFAFITSNSREGLALGGSMCRAHNPAVVAGGDALGFQVAGMVAHEIGHTMKAGHDRSKECPSGTYIMSPSLPGGSKAHTWSNCSRAKLQEFLNHRSSSCLDNHPIQSKSSPRWRDKLPGEIISPDQQCQYIVGSGSSHCRAHQTKCGNLPCRTLSGGCAAHIVPALDGSSCGKRNWCIRGHCVDNGKPYIDGGWSKWSDFVPCTMECGGGVTYKERTCTKPLPQNGGKPCEGSTKGHFKICNPEPCPKGKKSYREHACKEWDPVAVPHYVRADPCRLYCTRPGAKKHSKLGMVKDGAKCTQFSNELDVCIEGKCQAVGCDHRLGSGTKNDMCGVCAGNGTSCSLEKGIFNDTIKRGVDNAGLIVELPIGTSWALFQELGSTLNHIGIQDYSGTYLIDPNSKKHSLIQAAGAKVTHLGERNGIEQLQITGPTNAVLRIMYIRILSKNPGVQYGFYRPLGSDMLPNSLIKFEWKIPNGDEWSSCSAECAGGTQTRRVFCSRVSERSPVGDTWCRLQSKPISERECNVQPCPPEWHLSRWDACSKTCGKGVQTRSLGCRRKVKNLRFQEVSEDSCDAATKPNITEFVRNCREYKCFPVWKPQAWSQCSTSCNRGVATREVLCIETDEEGQDVVVPDILCKSRRPTSQQPCNLDKGCAPADTTCPVVSLCQNGATCVDDPTGYKCSCNVGYKGYFCEAQIDPCDNNPCFNGATCLQDDSDFLKYTCQCPIGYTGEKCEVRVNPCDSGPCLNEGVCVPDDDVVLAYSCNCVAGYSGETCEVPPSYEVACLKSDKTIYSVKLGKVVLNWKDTKPAIDSCRKLAHAKGLKNFAIGVTYQCVGMPNKEIQKKRTSVKNCQAGVGKKKSVFAYTFEPFAMNYTDLGCYKERSKKAALNEMLGNLRNQPQGANLPSIVEQCALMARGWGYDYFALVDRKICVSSQNAHSRYNMHGEITENVVQFCKDGVGLTKGSMEVYRFEE